LSVKVWLWLLVVVMLLTTVSGCARARIVVDMEITGVSNANGIGSGIAGKINGTDYLFITLGTQDKNSKTGVIIFDIRNLAKPQQIAYIPSPDNNLISSLTLKDNLLFVMGSKFLQVFDLTLPDSPQEIARTDTIIGRAIAISGKYAYYCLDIDTIVVMDISVISSPVIAGKWKSQTIPYYTAKMFITGNYLISFGQGVHIFDISSPVSLKELGYFNYPGADPRLHIPGQFQDIAISGKYVYIAATEEGLQIYDISDPADPWKKSELKGQYNYSAKVIVDGQLAYLLGDRSLFIIDISNPGSPKKLDSVEFPYQQYSNPYSYAGFAEANNYLYVFTRISKDGLIKLVIKVIDVSAFKTE
jgi:hypothetical protein